MKLLPCLFALAALAPVPMATALTRTLPSEELTLYSKERGALPVIIATAASEETERLAQEFVAALERITGTTFPLERSEAPKGIVFGTAVDWPGRLPEIEEGFSRSYAQEDYQIRTGEERLELIGRTALGLENAMWDVLRHLGFRHFFPGEHWEIWPKKETLSVRFSAFVRPDYYSRNFSFPRMLEEAEDVRLWERRNRMQAGFTLRAHHVYGAIIKRNARHFQEHPEDLVPADKDMKLDPSSPTLRELVVNDSLRLLRQYPDWNSLSMEPSDGGNWRGDSPLGSPSNQAVTLANHVASTLRGVLPERNVKVGMLAYHEHSPPPEIEVDRDVVVRVATAYIKQGYTTEALLKGWHAKGAETGISEFLSIWSWDYSLPARTRASDPAYLARVLPEYYALGARHWNAQATGSWASDGLGYYLCTLLLWDTSQAERLDEIFADFYDKAFGKAAGEMRALYEQCLLKNPRGLFSSDLIGRIYRHLKRALELAEAPEEQRRILDYVGYTRYLELTLQGRTHRGKAQREDLRALLALADELPDTRMVTLDLVRKRPPFGTPAEAKAERAALSPDGPATRETLLGWIGEGIAAHPTIGFEPVSYGSSLIPGPDSLRVLGGPEEIELIGDNRLALYASKTGETFRFTLDGARLYGNRGPVKVRLLADAHPIIGEPVAEAEVEADKSAHSVILKSPYPGAHWLEISDGGGGTGVSWPRGQRVAIPMSPEEKVRFLSAYRNSLAFYVPKGCRVIGGYSAKAKGQLINPAGEAAYDFEKEAGPGYFSVDVPEGQDGKLWRFHDADGGKLLLTVPPYLVRNGSELLVPDDAPPL